MRYGSVTMDGKFLIACALTALAVSGCSSIRPLADPGRETGMISYAAKNAADGKLVSVDYVPPQYALAPFAVSSSRMIETNILVATVTAKNMLGTADSLGWFDVGRIVEREFNKVVRWNFTLPPVVVPSTAGFSFSIERVSLTKEGDDVISILEVVVEISRIGHSDEVAYKKRFSSTRRERWSEEFAVPESFYAALNEIVRAFLEDWGKSRAMLTLTEWAKNPIIPPTPPHPPKPPTIESVSFTTNQNGVCGTCEVACNDYDAKTADAYASSYIEEKCRGLLMLLGVEPEQVRIVSDGGVKGGRGLYKVHAFARSKEPVLFFDGTSGHMTGDLALMGMTYEQALKEMRKRIQAEMDKVINGKPGEADVQWLTASPKDDVYGLLTVPFWLVKP